MAAGCRDSYPEVVPPLDVLYFPVGLAVRQVGPTPAAPYGSSQLVVLNSNFDLRYDEGDGGSVLVVDPDASQDSSLGGQLTVLGSARVASFGGELGMVDLACQPGWPDCPSACPTLATDPAIAAGGAKLVFGSRSNQLIYRMQMDASGALECGASCPWSVPIQQVSAYGVSTVCSARAGPPVAYAYVSHLAAANNLGFLSRVNLLRDDDVVALVLGAESTYTSIFNPQDDRLFVSSAISIDPDFRWFNPFATPTEVEGFLVPDYAGTKFSSFLPGAVARGMALSSDGLRLYVSVTLYDLTLVVQTGSFFTQGGALAVFDLSPTPLGEPSMSLRSLTRTCLGAGQIRRLPSRVGKADLIAVTCDVEGGLALYDSEAHAVVRYIGQDPTTGQPVLGGFPFGLAVEPIPSARATVPVQGAGYEPSPCLPGGDCQRIYVASFVDNWINVLELDPDRPTQVALVKRIGRGP